MWVSWSRLLFYHWTKRFITIVKGDMGKLEGISRQRGSSLYAPTHLYKYISIYKCSFWIFHRGKIIKKKTGVKQKRIGPIQRCVSNYHTVQEYYHLWVACRFTAPFHPPPVLYFFFLLNFSSRFVVLFIYFFLTL